MLAAGTFDLDWYVKAPAQPR